MPSIPSAEEIFREALKLNPDFDVNSLHYKTFEVMVRYRTEYYKRRVDEILSELNLPIEIHRKVKKRLLEPIVVRDKKYSNFMEGFKTRQPSLSTYIRPSC